MAKRIGNTWSALSEADNKVWESWENKFVPDCGAAATVGGEIVRAMDRLIYRFFNDGDMVGEAYGNETCNSSYRYLCRFIKNFPSLHGGYSDEKYEDLLLDGQILAYETLTNNPSLFERPNHEDSREADPEDYTWSQEDDEDDGWWGEDDDEFDDDDWIEDEMYDVEQ